MTNLLIKTNIQSYKHDEQIHRIWKQTTVIQNDDTKIVAINNKTKVVEKNGRTWYTKEPAVWYFFYKEWFNIIAMIRHDGIHYYCNLSSPAVYDFEGIKYIDYDLDIKVFPDGTYKILDQNEYLYNADLMNYSPHIKKIIDKNFAKIINLIETKSVPFNNECVLNDYKYYLKMTDKKKSK